MSPARARTGVERTNHKATAPPTRSLYRGVKTSEVFFVSETLFSCFILHCFKLSVLFVLSLVSFTGFFTEHDQKHGKAVR